MAQVIELKPNVASETVSRAQSIYLSGDIARAGAMAEMYLREHPDDAQALSILASCMKQADRTAIAYHLSKAATLARPDRPETWVVQGFAAQALWRMDEALDCYRKSLQRAVTNAQKGLYNNNIASVYLDLGQFAKAEEFVDESLKYDPNEKNTRHNKGLCLLARREWGEAWGWYSASIGSSQRTEFRYGNEPRWDGKPFKGTLVVYGEQGLGDEVCAASAVPDIAKAQKEAGGRLILDVDYRLKNLFARSFPDVTVHGTRWEKKLDWPEGDRNIGARVLRTSRPAPIESNNGRRSLMVSPLLVWRGLGEPGETPARSANSLSKNGSRSLTRLTPTGSPSSTRMHQKTSKVRRSNSTTGRP
jgi:tetratricopeptide (TPR) repeat protein